MDNPVADGEQAGEAVCHEESPRVERRRLARQVPEVNAPWSRVRLRAGRELVVLDASAAGVRVEGSTRLLPGTHLDVHLTADEGRLIVRGRVVRAWVARISADAIGYQGVIVFERHVRLTAAGYQAD